MESIEDFKSILNTSTVSILEKFIVVFYPTIYVIWWVCDKEKFSTIKRFIEIIGSFLTFIGLSPIIILAVLVNEFVRLILNKYLSWKTNGEIYLMPSGPDAAWGFEASADPSTCSFMLILKGKGDLEKVRKHFEINVLEKKDDFGRFPFQKLKQSVVRRLGYYCWQKDRNFDLRNHVKYVDEVQGSEDDVIKESEVNRIFERLTNNMLDSVKPQWEMLLIPNFKYDDETEDSQSSHYVIIARMHHTIGDAISWLHLIRYGMADKNDVKMSVEPLEPLNIRKWQIYAMYLTVFLLGPRSLFKFFTSTEKNMFHTRNRLTGPKYVQVQSRNGKFDLNILKGIKEKSKTSVTAVVNSCLAGGLRKLFLSQNQPVPSEINCITTGAMLPYPDYSPKNRFSLVPFPLAVGLEKLEDRLSASFEATLNFYRGPELPLFYFITTFLGRFPAAVISSTWKLGHATVAFSNIPGPTKLLTLFGGDVLVDAYGFTPLKCFTGISMSALSYSGNVRLSLLADHEAIKSEENCKMLLRFIEEELEAHARKYLS